MRAASANATGGVPCVVLVNPPFRYFPEVKHSSDSYTRPPLGIAYLASYLKAYHPEEVNVRLIDSEAQNYTDWDKLVGDILQMEPDIVGFSTVTGTVSAVSRIAKKIKQSRPAITTIAGGPHVTALPDTPIDGIDVNIFGEGEESLLEYLQEVLLGGSKKDIRGCIRFENGEIASRGERRPFIEDLDSVPIPARQLLPQASYFHSYPYPDVHNFTTMFTARGCPFNCNFCGNETLWERKVRFHSMERVFEEIDHIVAGGTNLIFFDDDTFNVSDRRVFEICAYVRRVHPSLRWICHIRADRVKAETLKEMKRSGCIEVQVGVESGDESVLASTDKAVTLLQLREAFLLLNEVKINSWGTLILGNMGETPQTIRKSIDFAKQINPTYATFIILLPFPGTPIFDAYKEKGYIRTYDWEDYSWHGEPVIDLPGLSASDLVALRKKAFLEFYMRPSKLYQIGLNTIQSLSIREISRNFKAWFSLVNR